MLVFWSTVNPCLVEHIAVRFSKRLVEHLDVCSKACWYIIEFRLFSGLGALELSDVAASHSTWEWELQVLCPHPWCTEVVWHACALPVPACIYCARQAMSVTPMCNEMRQNIACVSCDGRLLAQVCCVDMLLLSFQGHR